MSKKKQKNNRTPKLSNSTQREIINEVLLIDDTEIFNNEYNAIQEELSKFNSDLKNKILSNFLLNKLNEIDNQIKLAKQVKAGSSYIKDYISVENIERTKEIILDNLNMLYNGSNIVEDIYKSENINYKFKIYYSDMNERSPQEISVMLSDSSDLNCLFREIKKALDIYDFAKFQIYIEKDSQYKILDALNMLSRDRINSIKIAPS
jgi:hypothetical protein